MDTGSRGTEHPRWSLGIWPPRLPDSVASTVWVPLPGFRSHPSVQRGPGSQRPPSLPQQLRKPLGPRLARTVRCRVHHGKRRWGGRPSFSGLGFIPPVSGRENPDKTFHAPTCQLI